MPWRWSAESIRLRDQAHPELIAFADAWLARSPVDLKIIDTVRGRARQEEALRTGASRAKFGASAHNYVPAQAIDIVPYIVDPATGKAAIRWKTPDGREISLRGTDYVSRAWRAHGELGEAVARDLGLDLVWGGRFSSFYDAPHTERRRWRDERGALAP